MLIGIVGKPNVGKSTFFKALTLAEVLIANYPFATIEPNQGIAHVRVECPAENFFHVKCNPRYGYCLNGQRFVPVQVIDVAGLVPGAHEGKGMGNQFLDDLRQADVLIHVVDASGSTDEKGNPVSIGSYDPEQDIVFLEDELDWWYFGIINRNWDKFARQVKQLQKPIKLALAKQLSGLKVTEQDVEDGIKELDLPEDILKWQNEDIFSLARYLRKRTKPIVVVANKIDIAPEINVKKLVEKYNAIPVYADGELALKQAMRHDLIYYIPGDSDFRIIGKLNDAQLNALEKIREVMRKYSGTGVQKVINYAVFDVLKYVAVFPGGVNKLADSEGRVLPDCFLMPPGSTALDFAYKIHSDLGKNFIKAIDVKNKRVVGRDYVLKHLDVIEIVANR